MLKNARWARDTTVGVKVGMALSGALLSGWVLLHMLGNLLVFAGPDVINPYGAALQGSPLVWVMRLVIGAALAVHVAGAVVLTRRAREARQTRYRYGLKAQLSTLSSRTIRWGGLAVGLFLAYHLAHIFGPLHGSYVSGDVHHNLVTGLGDPVAGALYVLATIVFGLHLHHGTWSVFVTLGLDRAGARWRRVTAGFATIVTVGFLAPCVAALAGWL